MKRFLADASGRAADVGTQLAELLEQRVAQVRRHGEGMPDELRQVEKEHLTNLLMVRDQLLNLPFTFDRKGEDNANKTTTKRRTNGVRHHADA